MPALPLKTALPATSPHFISSHKIVLLWLPPSERLLTPEGGRRNEKKNGGKNWETSPPGCWKERCFSEAFKWWKIWKLIWTKQEIKCPHSGSESWNLCVFQSLQCSLRMSTRQGFACAVWRILRLCWYSSTFPNIEIPQRHIQWCPERVIGKPGSVPDFHSETWPRCLGEAADSETRTYLYPQIFSVCA